MRVYSIPVGPLQANAYLLVGEGGRGVIVDPGGEPERILAEVQRVGLSPEAILLTHAHFDHVGAVGPLVEALGIPVYLHPADLPLYQNASQAAGRWGLWVPNPPEPTEPLYEGQHLDFGLGLEVLFLPGHAPGHVGFYKPGHLVSGDVLFRGGIGRYDLPGADPKALFSSLQKLLQLPPDTVVYPGHGPPTTLGEERAHNPYLG
ncbi:Hydroxyacylglutathione hydrolase GloC [Meiothermus luteus]|jgi:glyoxylase-like metal-dependent hydrolase (beta-lactamase superfamily II)|uniref:Hydroxyacylglutathione hydrolase GloC n=1 Tax=Meiothermus luteus TaxID=2026184 RepID=A0A399EU45_9DEIN|nr:MBL fold metallo-hydrolase [Meiothermus luteus]RIH88134.1 Hydroxyacylglutathione hydrolase GloC [Meiothermus luteus]RMH55021.1 MAG: MBL fold metallo-hydrolase [Deinococcota bacterium]